MTKDYYKVLGVKKNASQDEIKKTLTKKVIAGVTTIILGVGALNPVYAKQKFYDDFQYPRFVPESERPMNETEKQIQERLNKIAGHLKINGYYDKKSNSYEINKLDYWLTAFYDGEDFRRLRYQGNFETGKDGKDVSWINDDIRSFGIYGEHDYIDIFDTQTNDSKRIKGTGKKNPNANKRELEALEVICDKLNIK